jgi:hypothetical protein
LCRLTFPVPVFLKRLEAPLCVFSLGIENQFSAFSCQLSVKAFSASTGSISSNDRTKKIFLRADS